MPESIAAKQLRDANQRLLTRTNDPDKIASTLQLLHSSLENRLRELLVRHLPNRRTEILIDKKVEWKELIDLSKQYLGLSEEDGGQIQRANYQRNQFSHGYRDNFTMSFDELYRYGRLVNELWETGSRQKYSYQQSRYTEPSPQVIRIPTPSPRTSTYWPDNSTSEEESSPEIVPPWPSYYPPKEKPWYRSTIFHTFLFIMFLPLWAAWILTDRDASGLGKTFAFLVLGFCCLMAVCLVGFLMLSISIPLQQVY